MSYSYDSSGKMSTIATAERASSFTFDAERAASFTFAGETRMKS